MTRKLKIYAHADSCNSFLPPDVIAALGERPHVRQGTVYVWATTAKAALVRLDALGLRISSTRELRVVDYGPPQLLNDAHPWLDGTVLTVRLSGGGRVVEIVSAELISERPYDVTRTLRTVGDLSNRLSFTPADVLEPIVTDEMFRAAQAILDEDRENNIVPAQLREALAAALLAQRTGS